MKTVKPGEIGMFRGEIVHVVREDLVAGTLDIEILNYKDVTQKKTVPRDQVMPLGR